MRSRFVGFARSSCRASGDDGQFVPRGPTPGEKFIRSLIKTNRHLDLLSLSFSPSLSLPPFFSFRSLSPSLSLSFFLSLAHSFALGLASPPKHQRSIVEVCRRDDGGLPDWLSTVMRSIPKRQNRRDRSGWKEDPPNVPILTGPRSKVNATIGRPRRPVDGTSLSLRT